MVKKNLKYLGLGLILLVLFYWFQIRPANIRKVCNKESYRRAGIEWKRENPSNVNESLVYSKDVDKYYEVCLRSKGLK